MMDRPCSYEELRACLRDIACVNRLTFGYRPTISWMEKFIAAHPSSSARPLRVVDVGCGDGDMLRRIDAWAAKRGSAVTLTGVDLNPDAIRAAKAATPSGQSIEWIVGDALSDAASGEIDVVISSLLTHHLTDLQIVQFLRWMDRTARRGWFINDLHRQPVPYHLFRLWARFTSWHPFVKYDGPVSIRRSFVVEDWHELCAAAGLASETVAIKEYRPARLCVGRVK
jgi:SAM-dependent methyltransferase